MVKEGRSFTQEQVTRVAAKLQQFMDGLPRDEQQILGAILRQAAEGPKSGEVSGYAALKHLTAEMTIYNPLPDDSPLGEEVPRWRRSPVTIPLPRLPL